MPDDIYVQHLYTGIYIVYYFYDDYACIIAYNLELLIIIDVIIYADSNSESTATISIISGTLGSLLAVALLVCGILIIVIAILRKKGNNTREFEVVQHNEIKLFLIEVS